MAKTRTEKIESLQAEIKQLENRRKQLMQEEKEQERKDRTKRLCQRMGLFESMLPDTIPLTDEQFKTFLEKTIATDHSRRILNGLTAQNAVGTAAATAAEKTAVETDTGTQQSEETAARDITAPASKTLKTARQGGADGGAETSDGARVDG